MTYLHIKQPSDDEGCGIAVMARLHQKSYDEMLSIAMENGFCDKKKRVNLAQMKRFLGYKGLENVSYKRHNGASVPTDCGIFHGRWNNVKTGTRHWIAYHDGMFFDPLLPQPVSQLSAQFYVTQIFKHP
ncbi:hypothetical protein [Pantoea stewartii]|uniref:hypothetical protein n=1 Tax=Pantoea stewartii TaxID=66269 RepID=UPI0006D245AB|nr:hypothetical protein [Pantoea stewartii]MDF7785072.1 hypothetical protein [Pantoea stewartii]MEB6534048.1 hypothetical protein [Pantoea stewartii]